MPIVILFDVDHTMTVSEGPIDVEDLKKLKQNPNIIVGLCGNLRQFFLTVPNWWDYISVTTNFDTGPHYGWLIPKDIWLRMFRELAYPNAERYILVGNRPGRVNSLGVVTTSVDEDAAAKAGWEFILEDHWRLEDFVNDNCANR